MSDRKRVQKQITGCKSLNRSNFNMKKLLSAMFAVSLVVLTGCGTAPTDPGVIAYDAEFALANGSADATHVFNTLYPSNSTPAITSTRQTLYQVDTNLGLTLLVLDAERTNYVATGETNASLAAAISATIATAQSQYATVTNLVNSVKKL